MKLLVYSDGGAPRKRPYASFAAYEVDGETDWGSDMGAHEALASEALRPPLVHVSREPLFPKRLSNTAAEAKALRMAVCWAGHYRAEHPEVTEVEFCADSRAVIDLASRDGARSREGIVRNEMRLIAANVKRNLRKVALKWTWIPGGVMKRTVINH